MTAVAGVVAVAVALRAWWLLALPRDVGRDGSVYARLAENLVAGAGYRDLTGAIHTVFPPGYPFAMAALMLLRPDAEWAGRIVSLIAGVGLVVVTYVIALRLWGRTAAIYAGLLTAVQPRLVDLSTAVLSESLYAFALSALTLATVAVLRAPRPATTAALGVGFGALTLVRPEAYLVALAAAVALADAAGWRPAEAARRVGLMLAAMAVPVAAYSAYLWTFSGAILTGKWANLREGAGPAGPGARWFVEHVVRNLLDLESALATELSLVVVVLAAAGVVIGARVLPRAALVFIVLSLALPLLAIATYSTNRRYFAPTFFLFFVLAAMALERLDGRAARWRVRHAGAAIVLLLFLHGTPMLSYPLRFSAWGDAEMTEQREVGRWILARYGPGRRILTRTPETVYYARGTLRPLRDIEAADLVAEARRTGSEFIVLDELMTRRTRPRLLELVTGPPPSDLRLVHESTPHPGRRVRVFTPGRGD